MTLPPSGETDQAVAGLEDIVQGALQDSDLYGCSGFNGTVTRLHFPLPKRGVNLAQDCRNLRGLVGGRTAMRDAIRAGIEQHPRHAPRLPSAERRPAARLQLPALS